MPKSSPRPSRQAYNNYVGVLGMVIGQAEQREKNGALLYKVLCSDCNQIHFRNAKHLKQGAKSRQCKEFKPHNHSGLDRWDAIIRRIYGISYEEYEKILKLQGGGCAICNKTPEEEGRRLPIDHCHATNKVRGILCAKCNQAIGLFRDDPELLQNAIDYLKANAR